MSNVQAPSAATIPGVLLDFLERATVGVAGTRDAALVPRLYRLGGWRADPDGKALTCLVPEVFTAGLLEALQENGRIAVTIEEIGPHETYQFKGRYLDHRPCDEEDQRLYRWTNERFARVAAAGFGLDVETCLARNPPPVLAVRFAIETIYVQTPGPAAGRRLVPPEDAPASTRSAR